MQEPPIPPGGGLSQPLGGGLPARGGGQCHVITWLSRDGRAGRSAFTLTKRTCLSLPCFPHFLEQSRGRVKNDRQGKNINEQPVKRDPINVAIVDVESQDWNLSTIPVPLVLKEPRNVENDGEDNGES